MQDTLGPKSLPNAYLYIPTLYQQVPAPWPVLCTRHQWLVQMQCGSHQYHCQLQTWTQSAMY